MYSNEPCLLASNISQLDATLITAQLTDADIPYFIKDHGTGGYMKLYMGYTIYGQDIYVGTGQYDKAKEIVDQYFTASEEDRIEDTLDTKHGVLLKNTLARIIVIMVILLIVTVMILDYLH